MSRVRVCGSRCHSAKGTRCHCWCSGSYHGSSGAANRQALQESLDPEDELEKRGFKKGETGYKEQLKLMEVPSV